jgi:hypothetical protein
MSDHWNSIITFACGVLLGAVLSVTIAMVWSMVVNWRGDNGDQ